MREYDYPYIDNDGYCNYYSYWVEVDISNYYRYTNIKTTLQSGPAMVSFRMTDSLSLYGGGIFDNYCSSGYL